MEIVNAGFFASPAVIIAGLALLGAAIVSKFSTDRRTSKISPNRPG